MELLSGKDNNVIPDHFSKVTKRIRCRVEPFGLLLLLVLVFSYNASRPACAGEGESTEHASRTDYTIIGGEWLRTDGNYIIRARDTHDDGQVTVEYFNPNPIHVAHAKISTQQGLIKLFIKFQDKGYEGSTYTLYYYAEKDALVGFYHQAVMERTFEVIFLRKNS